MRENEFFGWDELPLLKKKKKGGGIKKKKSNGSYDKPAFTDEELFLEEGDIKVSWHWSLREGINMRPLQLGICCSACLPLEWLIMTSKRMVWCECVSAHSTLYLCVSIQIKKEKYSAQKVLISKLLLSLVSCRIFCLVWKSLRLDSFY